MPQPIDRCDWDQRAHQIRRHGAGLGARAVEPDDEEADGDVEGLARDLMLVHKCPPVSMDWDEAQRTGAPAKVSPAPSRRGRRQRRRQVAVGGGQSGGGSGRHDAVQLRLLQCRSFGRLGCHARNAARVDGRAASCTGSPDAGSTIDVVLVAQLLQRLLRRGLSSTPGHWAHVILHLSF